VDEDLFFSAACFSDELLDKRRKREEKEVWDPGPLNKFMLPEEVLLLSLGDLCEREEGLKFPRKIAEVRWLGEGDDGSWFSSR